MHVNLLGIIVTIITVAVIIGGPAMLVHRVWKFLGRRR